MKKNSRLDIQKLLKEAPACYVLITCDAPSDDGKMQVEMSYEGDAALAAYILQGAQLRIDEQELEAPSNIQDKIRYFP